MNIAPRYLGRGSWLARRDPRLLLLVVALFVFAIVQVWDVRLLLRKNEVPPLTLGGGRQLGWTTWLGRRRTTSDADDLCIDAERFVERA